MGSEKKPLVGVLALQGSFAEHLKALSGIPGVAASPVRSADTLATCSALIIPGGESTTLALLAERHGLLEPLREFVRSGQPVWGTCAGAILLSDEVVEDGIEKGVVKSGMIGGARVRIVRNQWGRQAQSFAVPLDLSFVSSPSQSFISTFIRAPIVHDILSPKVALLAYLPASVLPQKPGLGKDAGAVMLRDENVVLSTFHPELGEDNRVHEWFVREVVHNWISV